MNQREYRCSINRAQEDMYCSVKRKNLEAFIQALAKGADVNERTRKEETGYDTSTFEHCLTMKGMAKFIEACLKHGAHAATFNPITNKYPIHLAVETCDVHNLQELVKSHRLLIDQKFNGCTALLMLFEMLTAENWENVFECIKVLLEQGADINTSDPDEKSPIAILVSGNDSWRKPILEYCFAHHYVDVDIKMSVTNNELIRDVIQKHFPDVVIPTRITESDSISISDLETILMNDSELEFLEACRKFRAKQKLENPNNEGVVRGCDISSRISVDIPLTNVCISPYENLLQKAALKSKLKAIALLLEPFWKNEQIMDANCIVRLLSCVLHMCCDIGNVKVLEWCLNTTSEPVSGAMYQDSLLSSIDMYLSSKYDKTMLIQLIQHMDRAVDKSVCPFFKCMHLLLQDKRIYIDAKTQDTEMTALQCAANFKVIHAQELLLSKGAPLYATNIIDQSLIIAIDTIVLEKYLDSRVTSYYQDRIENKHYFDMDLSKIVRPRKKKSKTENESNFYSWNDPIRWKPKCHDELRVILSLASSFDKRHLLQHPVIQSVLLQKWRKLKYFFYANLLLCAVFSALFMLYVTLFYGRDDTSNVWYSVTYISLIVLLICMALRELIQICFNVKEYIRSLENYLEIALIAGAAYVLYLDYINDGQTAVPALIAILPALNLTLLVGSLPILSLSTHMVMLKTVSKNFYECILLYAIILLTFAASFYALFQKPNSIGNNTQSNEQQETFTEIPDPYGGENITEILKSLKQSIDILKLKIQNKNGDEVTNSFDRFESFPLSIVKTIVMLTGELNVSDMPLTGVIPYIILVIFVFFVPIVLANLINGLAISDIAAIKAESELIGLAQRVSVIYKLETALVFPTFLQNITDRLSMLRCFNRFSMFSKMDVKPIICFGWKRSKYSKELSYGVWLMVFKSTNHPKQTNFSNIYENCEAERSGNNAEDTDSERFENHTIPRDNKNYRFMSLKKDERIVKYMLNIMKQRRKTIDPVEDKLTRLAQQQEELMNHIATLRNELHGLVDSIKDKFAQEKPPSSV